ncbi:MAG: kinase/pyrophosphorylase [Gammaproteobacteria bacterium]|nr:kinase/pyrophosphorylase [Gammaproteobacteria bacterium]
MRTAFFISDRTSITAEALGNSLLTQFGGIEFKRINLAFIDSFEKAEKAANKIKKASESDGQPPLVFSTQISDEYRSLIEHSGGILFDFFDTFISRMEKALGKKSSHAAGLSHGVTNTKIYAKRIESIDFALHNDDGLNTKNYGNADIILTGVSRSGKTPTCLFLALQYGIYAANYPLIEEDLQSMHLPQTLQKHKKKLFGLSINPVRLQNIRDERRSNSSYASINQCQKEVRRAEDIYLQNNVPFLDTSQISIEEIATRILNKTKLKRRY